MSQSLMIAIIIGVALIAIASLVVGGLFLWRMTVRRYVVTLIGKRAGIEAAYRTIETLVTSLAAATDGELVAFALDSTAEQRKTLEEVAEQMAILGDELATMPLPKHLRDSADVLADAADELTRQAGALTGKEGIEALDALAAVDVARVRQYVDTGIAALSELAERYDVDDTAVYGGGLYI